MEEKNAHRKPTEESDIPISVPSVDAAWNEMRKKLDREKPIAELVPDFGTKGISKSSFNRRLISITLISIIAAIFFVRKNISPVSQIVAGNKLATSTEKTVSKKEADKITQDIDLQRNEPKEKSNQGNQNISDSALTISPTKDLSRNEKEQDSKSMVIADGGIGKPLSGFQLNNPQTRYSKPIKGKKNKNSFPANLKLQKPESKITKGKTSMANTSITNVDETPAVANINTFQVEDQNELNDSNQIRLVDSTSMPEKEITGSDTSSMKNLYISKNIGGPDTIENSHKWRLQAGLSWSLQLPISGTRGYFQGPNTNSQPFRVLFPAIWLQSVIEKSMLSLEIDPFISNLLPEKPFRTATTVSYLPDTTVTTTEVKTLYKVFGLSTSIGYNYNLSRNWWIGGNMQFCWWAKGIAYSNGLVQKTPVNGGTSAPDSFFKEEYQISDEWSYFNRAQLFINAEFLYRKEKWQAGITSGISAAPLAKNEGPGNSFRMALFYRWALYTKR